MIAGYREKNWKSYLKGIYNQTRYKKNDFRHYISDWQGIAGWLHFYQAEWLFDAARTHQAQGNIVEIGSAFGRSTVAMGLGLKSGGKGHIYAVDPHTGGKAFIEELGESASEFNSLQSFRANIERFNLESLITPVVATSNEAVADGHNGKIRLAYI